MARDRDPASWTAAAVRTLLKRVEWLEREVYRIQTVPKDEMDIAKEDANKDEHFIEKRVSFQMDEGSVADEEAEPVHAQEVVKEVPVLTVQEVVKEVPRILVETEEKDVEVDKKIAVPQVQEVDEPIPDQTMDVNFAAVEEESPDEEEEDVSDFMCSDDNDPVPGVDLCRGCSGLIDEGWTSWGVDAEDDLIFLCDECGGAADAYCEATEGADPPWLAALRVPRGDLG